MPTVVADLDRAVHRKAVELELGCPGMKDGRVIGIAGILPVQLPIRVEILTVIAENAEFATRDDLEILHHARTDIVAQRFHLVAERPKDQPTDRIDPEPLEPMLRLVE